MVKEIKARLSRSSGLPICIWVVTSEVAQKTLRFPEASISARGWPGLSSRTKRFRSVVRVAGVMRENAWALRIVRERANSVEFWEQAANKMARKVSVGSAGEADWASHCKDVAQYKKMTSGKQTQQRRTFQSRKTFLSILGGFQDGGKIPCE